MLTSNKRFSNQYEQKINWFYELFNIVKYRNLEELVKL